MHSWWKFSPKETKKKTKKINKETIFDVLQRKLKIPSESKSGLVVSPRCASDITCQQVSLSRVPSRSPSPSSQVSRCQSFAESTYAQPLPLPGLQSGGLGRPASGINASKPGARKSKRPSLPSLQVPLPEPLRVSLKAGIDDLNGELAIASVFSDCSSGSDDPADSRLPSPRVQDTEVYENGIKTATNSPTRVHRDNSPLLSRKNTKEILKPGNIFLNNQSLSSSPKRNIADPCSVLGNGSAPDSSMSSPSRSPMSVLCPEHITTSTFSWSKAYPDVGVLGSCPCSSPGSGYNSGHNSMGGDLSGQFWQQCRGSSECSPVPSPRMTSPGPSSRIHSGAVTPLHPRAGGSTSESPICWPEDGKQQRHRLPLPPISVLNSSLFNSPSSTAGASVPRSPGRADTPVNHVSRWKKGKPLGSGTFGQVYVGFNSESGEMCAMKEVSLFLDDSKSKESAKQLMQEVTLLSRYRHPNIVQYYGSETVDDKLYIYLEYVSGGSVFKLLKDYGQLGELAIRNYTQQILCGLAYLHANNIVHRDIKGANILVDPNGRVKLADFGTAKHITGQPCPLSFKGSPYWMAPEVIKHTKGCNLAVDIWSLGCTVIEMATTKPPWSDFEGVAAMFKIGNSKELPVIPDNLSEEGRDFVTQCLQRNPQDRPTAGQLLLHPFVKNAAPLERPIPNHDMLESPYALPIRTKPLSTKHSINMSSLEVEGVDIYKASGGKASTPYSEIQVPRNISCPVSPIGSPVLKSGSAWNMNGPMSSSPISSPRTKSGSSSPLTGGNGALPFALLKQSAYPPAGSSSLPRSPNHFYTASSNHQDSNPDLFRPPSNAFHLLMASENGVGKPFRTGAHGEALYEQPPITDRISNANMRGSINLNSRHRDSPTLNSWLLQAKTHNQ